MSAGAPRLASPPARAAGPGAPNRNAAFAGALLEELARAGVRGVCLCPGSRSTPLAIAAASTPGLRTWVHLDERAAGFFAVGLARAARAPVALLCTSGTAAANFLPAVIEASLSSTPLVVLTADRPPELRGWGAAQTIDQIHLFGSHVRWFAELPTPEPVAALLRHVRAAAARAASTGPGPPAGPVHLNVPLREPLEPTPVAEDETAFAALADPLARAGRESRGALAPPPYTAVESPPIEPPPGLVARLTADVRAARRGVLLVGPQDGDPALPAAAVRLARAAGWPLLADAASQLRRGPHVAAAPICAAHDAFLRAEGFAARRAPELVLRIGAPPTSKATARWIEHHPGAELRLVDPGGGFADPSHRAAAILRVDPTRLCTALAAALEAAGPPPPSRWLEAFLGAERAAALALARGIDTAPALFAPAAVGALARALPPGAALFASNSMPVREVEGFLRPDPRPLRVLVSRGANGIDGVTSTALGAAAALGAPLALLTGDLAFLHDVGGLLAARRHDLDATILVVNDDGGGIFSYLPLARFAETVDFETLFATPHGLELAHATALAGGRHHRVHGAAALDAALDAAIGAPGLDVIELPVAREAQVAHHQALWSAAARAVEGETP